ncbi:MAG: phytoene desaturase family protein [Candidatus Methanofastidiosia archaeon]
MKKIDLRDGTILLGLLIVLSSLIFLVGLETKETLKALALGFFGIFGLLYSTHIFGHLLAGRLEKVKYRSVNKRSPEPMDEKDVERLDWDVIVIGSGISGMTTAVGLANEGKKVLILEQHYIPGGYATCFKRKGFTFEVSLHQTSGLGHGQTLNMILTELGVMDKITPIKLKETMLIKTPRGNLSMGADYLDQLRKMFPNEVTGLNQLDNIIDNIMAEMTKVMKLSMLPAPVFNLFGRFFAPTVYKYRNKTLAECLDELFTDPLLKQLVAVQWGYFGLPLGKISSVLYLLGWGGFLKEGIYYIKGTSQSLSNAFIDRLEELGGQLLVRQRVEKIVIENNRAVGVLSRKVKKDGMGETYEFRAPVIISNANPFLTFNDLVGRENLPHTIFKKMEKMEASSSALVVYIGLDCPLRSLTNDKFHSIMYIKDENLDFDRVFQEIKEGRYKGMVGITDYSSINSSLAPQGKTSMVLINSDFMKNWEGLSDEEYRNKKKETTEEILSAVESNFPGFRDHIEVMEVATPHTMARYTSNYEGAFNGFAYTTDRVGMGKGGLNIKSPLKGLYMSSAWIGATSGGYYGCITNGYMAAKVISRTANWKR